MPILTPFSLPPDVEESALSSSTSSSSGCITESATSTTLTSLSAPPKQPKTVVNFNGRVLNIPSICLNEPFITDDMAACLAINFLGHVLFLKNQVPFPVMQLHRLPPSSNPRASKKRADMSDTFDELTSHIHTTFSTLSDAFARNGIRSLSLHSEPHSGITPPLPLFSAYMAILVGPTPGAPKARVILALEGLQVKKSGTREDLDGVGDDDEDLCKGEQSSNDEDEVEAGVETEDRGGSEKVPEESVGDASQALPLNSTTRPHAGPAPRHSYAEAQQPLRAAERLLSRALASAAAEDGGMASELAPTHIHVMLRAPRCFAHPAWVPRQNLSSSLEASLLEFLTDSGLAPTVEARRPRRGGVRTEGVHVGCAALPISAPIAACDVDNEMIWWAWNGKLTGFSEW
ncbi:hypothetical protein K488DRAFT_54329 [Vararia minispora EC-137]|uniref:Uncharacterized protein n=1 Tax=Vararia minispora EC-137 TaxID=1314806 RepID=A0ACB8QF08_9AGAM|nr:hypothetical protein K488DRAFT_54329 [Vararia minispora EC-137]